MKKDGSTIRFIKQILKRIISDRTRYFIKRVGPYKYIQCLIAQKVFRINSHVPWPCSWTSTVGDVKKIQMKTFPPFPGLGNGQYIQVMNGIKIGANVRLGPGVKLISANHNICDYEHHLTSDPIVLGDNCWIGADAIILPGVLLGDHVIVAAGAVVTKSFSQNNILLAGNPAKNVKKLGSYRGKWDHIWLLDEKN